MTYENIEFWKPVAESPADQGFHWNRNAMTYVNMGLAMGDAMSTLSPARCPSRLRASGGAGGITLTWQNGSEIPTSVRVLRGATELAASVPGDPASFTDASVQPGLHPYEVQFTMSGDPCPPLTVTFDGGITGFVGFRSPGGIALTWENNLGYSGIELRRDGVLLQTLAGTAISFTDADPPASGLVTYTVVPTNGSAVATELQINLDGPPSGNAVIYEPFDYTVGGLNLQGGAEAGLDGQWFANSTALVTAGTLSFGDLPVGGAKLSDFTASQNRFGGSRAILPSALAGNGLLDDGATLWFSFITGIEADANRTNSRLAVALSAGPFGGGNGSFFIEGGTGVGFQMSAGVPRAAFFPDGTGSAVNASNGSPQFRVDETGLIVGRITWGGTSGEFDTVELFKPDTDLVLPSSPISTLTMLVDQSTFDTLTFRRGDKPVLDEIRFGQSYNDVIGADLVTPDFDSPQPNPMGWASAPSALSDSQITMTAVSATDDSGVEYYFEETSGNAGGTDSGWQDASTYVDTGLNPTTTYSYRVQARDKSGNANETGFSATENATTTTPDNLPPTPNTMSFASPPEALSVTEVTMTAVTANDPSGVEYFFDEVSGNPGGDDSDWQDSPTYIDVGLTTGQTYHYTVTARDKSSAANETASSAAESATTPDLPDGPGGALLYEPFDYDPDLNVSGNNGGVGFGGAWSSTKNNPIVSSPSKTWGSLTTAGNHARGGAWSGLIRPLGSTLSDAGLMADGATLWFSVILDLDGQNTANADINVALATDRFVSNPFGDRENLVGGEGVGVTHSGGTIQGVYWQNQDADAVSERSENNSSTVINGSGGNLRRALIVGKVEWGANDTASETLTLYAPDPGLVQGPAVMSAWTIPALDQSQFDSLAIQFKDQAQVDEIRFGETYEDVIGMGGESNDYEDWVAGYPGVDLSDPDGDDDGDGLSNNEERIWGLDPTSGSAMNPFSTPFDAASGSFSYSRRELALTGLTYRIMTSTDLDTWTEDSTAVQTAGTPNALKVETVAVSLSSIPTSDRFFVRIEVVE